MSFYRPMVTMGMIKRWLERRRKTQLEQINQQIEELKRRGPDYTSIPDKTLSSRSQRNANSGSTPILIMSICIIALIAVSIFAWTRITALNKKYSEVEESYEDILAQKKTLQTQLNQTTSQLEEKKEAAQDLSKQYIDLEQEITFLEGKIDDLNDTITSQTTSIKDLQEQVQERDNVINQIEECILNSSIEDKEDCI